MLNRIFAGFLVLLGGALLLDPPHRGVARGADEPAPAEKPAAKPLTVGFVYVGDADDCGYNQAMAQGAAAVKQMPGVTIVEQQDVPETKACQEVMTGMIDRKGASIIFATSFGYFRPHVQEVALANPNVTFFHAGGMVRQTDPKNIGTFFAYIDEAEWLCGMAAGAATKTGKLGYIAAKPISPVLRDINAFALGAKSVNPKCTVTVIFTGDWYRPDKEIDSVNALADKGIDVVTGHIDSLKVLIKTAEKRGIMSCGYHFDGSALAPAGYLTGAEWNWAKAMTALVADTQAGKPPAQNAMGSLANGWVGLSPFGKAVSKQSQENIQTVKEQMIAGKFQMFKGPLNDNTGREVLPAGKAYDDQDLSLWGMNYLVEGVVGTPQ